MTLDQLRAAVDQAWLRQAERDPRREFPRAARALGHRPLSAVAGWTAAEAGRAALLGELTGTDVTDLYHEGDPHERLAILKTLPLLRIGDAGVPLLQDALRSNDTRLVGAALGPYADRLDQPTWRHGVVKCVFMGIPTTVVHRLSDRADPALAAMLAALAEERLAAGRPVPPDAADLLAQFDHLPAAAGEQKDVTR